MKRATVAVAVVVIFAGCSGALGPDNSTATETSIDTVLDSQLQTKAATATPSPTTTETMTPTATVTQTPTPRPQNPWNSFDVVVALNNSSQHQEYAPILNQSVAAWNNRLNNDTAYDLTLQYRPQATDPDINVKVESGSIVCDFTISDFVGCAPYIEPDSTAPETAEVQVKSGLPEDALFNTTMHELGHVLGKTHESNISFMTENLTVYKTDVGNRSNPFGFENKFGVSNRVVPTNSIYIHAPLKVSTAATLSSEVKAVAEYYNNSSIEGISDNTTFEHTAALGIQQIEVDKVDVSNSKYLNTSGSIGVYDGVDTDHDGKLEFYTNVEIQISEEIPNRNVGYHVAYWIAKSHHLEEKTGSLPDAISGNVDRSDWEDNI